jgi:FMN phosphatase YigB (HAD superfamily)
MYHLLTRTFTQQVIHKAFQPLLAPGHEVPKELAPRLLHRFSSNEAYTTSSDILSLLRSLKHHQSPNTRGSFRRIVVGVVTNSDDRVPGILSSLGFHVSPLRFGHNIDTTVLAGGQYDIDLHCMSYDVGFAKPDRRIFEAAEAMANTVIAMQNGAGPARDGGRAEGDVPWLKLYVGDEFQTDVMGARGAGWNSILVGPETDSQEQLIDIGQTGNIPLDDVFPLRSGSTVPVALQAGTSRMVLEWLITQRLGNN